ncbi:MAG: oxidoreductase [Desulfitobacterium sp.]|nr:oxidoreductase [Desulfitobacterium sp.]
MWDLLKRSLKMGRLTEKHKEENAPHLRSFQQSWHIRHLDCGSCNGCDWEMNALLNPVYDLQRFGFDFVASPRHGDILMCTGPMSTQLVQAAHETDAGMPKPKVIIAVGDCSIDGGVFKSAYGAKDGIEGTLKVDVEIPGCPPSPEQILDVLLQMKKEEYGF